MSNEIVKTVNLGTQFVRLSRLPVARQLGLLTGLAASVAIGVYVVMWSQTPSYQTLFHNLAEKDANRVVEALKSGSIVHRIDPDSGAVQVANGDLHRARMLMAENGLPNGAIDGFELLEKKKGFGVSQFMEKANYQRALEGELARSVSSISSIKQARVHLALPKQSSFVRKAGNPSASVIVEIYGGRTLDAQQVGAITYLVSSSIPGMTSSNVTVIDSRGNLLSSRKDSVVSASSSNFKYTTTVEQSYVKRILDVLEPVTGIGNVRAQVTAEIDYSSTDSTTESYNPESRVIRSEEVSEESKTGARSATGVPGALSNVPKAAGQGDAASQPESTGNTNVKNESGSQSGSRRTTRNYEIEKTVSRTRNAPGLIRKLSVAVMLNNRTGQQEGNPVQIPWTPDELEKINSIVVNAVGINDARGDRIQVVSMPFAPADKFEPLPEPPLWKQPMVLEIVKQAMAGLAIIILIFGVLRPFLRSMATLKISPVTNAELAGAAGIVDVGHGDASALNGGTSEAPVQGGTGIASAKSLVQQDPKRVAQVVKTWISDNG